MIGLEELHSMGETQMQYIDTPEGAILYRGLLKAAGRGTRDNRETDLSAEGELDEHVMLIHASIARLEGGQ